MKRIFSLSLLCLLLSCSAPSQPADVSTGSKDQSAGFRVTGQINGKSGGSLYLIGPNSGNSQPKAISVDATGHFEFRDTVTTSSPGEYGLMEPSVSTLFKGGAMMGIRMTFYAENGDDITISGDLRTFDLSDISGNVHNDQLMELRNALKEFALKEKAIWDQVLVLMRQRNPANKPKIEELGNSTDPYEKQIIEIKKNFVSRHPDYMASSLALSQLAGKLPLDEMEKLYAALSPVVKASASGDKVAENIGLGRAEDNAEAGKPAPDFIKKDRDGHEVKLSDYKGKYVLLDFWGSWCGACRAGNPHLKELNKKYRPQGLVVIGISEERTKNKAAWLKAIKEDGLPWTQIMNDEGKEQSDVVSLYGVKAFPTKILIGPDGKIVLRTEGTTVTGGAGHDDASSSTGASTTGSSASAGASSAGASSSGVDAAYLPADRLETKLREIFKN